MNQLAGIWKSLSIAQRVSLVIVPILVCAIAYAFTVWKHDSDFRLLYTGLAPDDAAAVTQKIREAGIEYRLDETGAAISVPSGHVAEARLALAGAGLPRSGRIGFELFDRNNLGASDFAEQVNYRRALEGELERTVATLSEVEQARIHITFARDSVFLDARQPSKATVVLRLRRSTQLPQASVNAIANLVAGAVDNLLPEAVAIIDSNGRLLNRPRAPGDAEAQLAEANLDYRQQVEQELMGKINAAIGPLLGPDRFRASVNVDCDFTSSEQSEETVDSDKTAVLTSQTSEESAGGGASGGMPGSASNLPRPPARAAANASGVIRHTENLSYQPSRTVKRTVSPRGSIRRISAAILVDQTVKWEGSGVKAKKTMVPPSPETLKVVHDMVAGIVGYTEQRGDQITVETLPFENTVEAEPPVSALPAPAGRAPAGFNFKQPVVIGGAVGGVLLVAGLVFFLSRRKRSSASAVDTALAAVAAAQYEKGPHDSNSPASSHGAGTALEQQLSANDAESARIESEALSRIRLPENTRKTEVLAKHIRDSVAKDPGNVTNVLRNWIADSDGKRTP